VTNGMILEAAAQQLAQQLFDAYNNAPPNPWKTFDGRDVPRWDGLTEQVRGKWLAAARAAINAFEYRPLSPRFSEH
jgi:hypothetical protein